MSHTQRIFAMLVLCILAVRVVAQDNRNGATWYQRGAEYVDQLTNDDWNLIMDYQGPGMGEPSPELRAALARAQQMMGFASRGAQQPHSDYGLDYAQGFEMLLPHLAPMRQMAKAMRADALVKLHDGDVAGASQRMASMYGMAGHTGSDRVLISSLVGQAIFNAGDQALQAALDHALLSPTDAASVLSALTDLPQRDPFGYVECMAMEHELGRATIEQMLDDEQGDDIATWFGGEDEIPAELRDLSRENLQSEIDKYDAMMHRVTEAFAMDDPDAARLVLDDIEREIERGDAGAFVKLLMPAFGKMLDRKIESEAKLAERIEVLTAIAGGELDAIVQANAAIWYLRAASVVTSLPTEQLAALRNWDRDRSGAIDQPLIELMKNASAALDLVRQAQQMKRCDFAAVRSAPQISPEIAPRYAAELRDLLRFLLLEANHAMRQDQPQALDERLRLLLNTLAHFDGDPVFAVAAMTHDAFNQTIDLIRQATSEDRPTIAQREALFSIADRISRQDPFGYVAATIKARQELAGSLNRVIDWETQEAVERAKTMHEQVKTLPASDVMFVALLLHTVHDDEAARGATEVALTSLVDLFDEGAMRSARQMTPEIAPLLASLDIEAIRRSVAPDVMQLDRRMRAARQDLRDALKSLRPPQPEPQEATKTADSVATDGS